MIRLYIGNQLADLTDDSFVLLNYALTDLTNPTIMKNSWSQDIDLPMSPNNNRIFGASFRLDRNAGVGGTGVNFNAGQKTDFAIYNELNEILYSGYLKLNSVTDVYKVSLFGGLGDWLYSLSYDANGEKLTLADLDYGQSLDFVINASNVLDAWARINGDTSKPDMWDIINFAPCYNGLPEDFDSDKAVLAPADFLLADSEDGYSTSGGYSTANLTGSIDEWAAKDLRSYLQRPVVNFWEVLSAIKRTSSWSVDLSDLSSFKYKDLWLTRPLLPSLGTYKKTTGSISVTRTMSPNYVTGPDMDGYSFANVPAGAKVTAGITFNLMYNIPSSVNNPTLSMYSPPVNYQLSTALYQVVFIQAIGYASDNTQVGASKTIVYSKPIYDTPNDYATACSFTPNPLNANMEFKAASDFNDPSNTGVYTSVESFDLQVEAQNLSYVKVFVYAYSLYPNTFPSPTAINRNAAGYRLYRYSHGSVTAYNITGALLSNASCSATMTPSDSLRSGAQITKKMLLSTAHTPAEYLVSYCKMFGLYILADSATKSVQILSRNSLYQNDTIDLTKRIDKGLDLTPIPFDAKWYDFKQEATGGRFMDEYQKTEGVQYGIQRVDTGYDFDAADKDLLNGNAFKACAAVRDRGKYYLTPYEPVTPEYTITNSQYIADAGWISVASPTFNLLKVHITAPGVYTFGTNITNTHPILGEYDSVYGYNIRIVQGAGTMATLTLFLTPGYYALCSDGNATLSVTGRVVLPPVFMNPGNQYTLWNANGENLDKEIPVATNYDWMNQTYNGYDIAESRPEFRDADNKGIDGQDVLLVYNFGANYNYFSVSDDLAVMDLKNGKPCWYLQPGSTIEIPWFTRYTSLGQSPIDSLEFGTPREIDIPNGFADLGDTIYQNCWSGYIRDRLDASCKVLKCSVNLRGLQVGPELFRKLYYYRGSLWVLSKISNYSLTTFDPAECEFIQVRDYTKYTNGQSI